MPFNQNKKERAKQNAKLVKYVAHTLTTVMDNLVLSSSNSEISIKKSVARPKHQKQKASCNFTRKKYKLLSTPVSTEMNAPSCIIDRHNYGDSCSLCQDADACQKSHFSVNHQKHRVRPCNCDAFFSSDAPLSSCEAPRDTISLVYPVASSSESDVLDVYAPIKHKKISPKEHELEPLACNSSLSLASSASCIVNFKARNYQKNLIGKSLNYQLKCPKNKSESVSKTKPCRKTKMKINSSTQTCYTGNCKPNFRLELYPSPPSRRVKQRFSRRSNHFTKKPPVLFSESSDSFQEELNTGNDYSEAISLCCLVSDTEDQSDIPRKPLQKSKICTGKCSVSTNCKKYRKSRQFAADDNYHFDMPSNFHFKAVSKRPDKDILKTHNYATCCPPHKEKKIKKLSRLTSRYNFLKKSSRTPAGEYPLVMVSDKMPDVFPNCLGASRLYVLTDEKGRTKWTKVKEARLLEKDPITNNYDVKENNISPKQLYETLIKSKAR